MPCAITFGSTDIRLKQKPVTQKDAIRTDNKEIKRLERKRKKQGKLSKEENIVLDSLHSKRKNLKKKNEPEVSVKETVEGEGPSIRVKEEMGDDFDESFDYNNVQSVQTGGIIDYLDFNFEAINANINELSIAASDDDFDYNKIETTYSTQGVIDYYAPISKPNPGYIWFEIILIL